MDADDIALLDVLDREITLVGIEVSLYSLAINGYAISRLLGIAILVKIARHHLVANPSWNTNQEIGILHTTLLHSNLDIAIPRILGSLLQNYILAIHLDGRCIAGKEIHVDIVILHAIEIARNRRDEAAQITWAAGTSKPRLAGSVVICIEGILAIARQWVRIEETTTIHTHTRNDTIIQTTLQTVDILALAVKQEHALKEINHRDGCTGLVVGCHVWQLIVITKCLTCMAGTYSTCKIVFLANDVFKNAVDHLHIGRILGQGSHIGDTGIHISSTNSMTYRLFLLQDRSLALRIWVADMSLATIIEQILSLIQILLLAGQGIETSQRHLCNLMSRNNGSLSNLRTYFPYHTIGIALGDVQELGATCSLIVSTGCIYHVTEIVKLVAQILILDPTLISRPSVWMLWVDSTSGIEIAIWLLCRTYHIEHAVDISLQLLVRISLEDIAGSFDGLVNIGIIEREAHELAHIPLFGLQARMVRMLQSIGSHLEILVTVLALTLAESQWHSYLTGSLQAGTPEGVL